MIRYRKAPAIQERQVRFLAFLLMLLVLTLIVLYVIGDRRQPQQRVIVMPVELEAKETPR